MWNMGTSGVWLWPSLSPGFRIRALAYFGRDASPIVYLAGLYTGGKRLAHRRRNCFGSGCRENGIPRPRFSAPVVMGINGPNTYSAGDRNGSRWVLPGTRMGNVGNDMEWEWG